MSDLPREGSRLRVTPNPKCNHPKVVALFKFLDFDETVFRCMVCGKTMTTSFPGGRPLNEPERKT